LFKKSTKKEGNQRFTRLLSGFWGGTLKKVWTRSLARAREGIRRKSQNGQIMARKVVVGGPQPQVLRIEKRRDIQTESGHGEGYNLTDEVQKSGRRN